MNSYQTEDIGFSFSNYDKEATIDNSGQIVFMMEDNMERHNEYKGSRMLSITSNYIVTDKGDFYAVFHKKNGYEMSKQDSLLVIGQMEETIGKIKKWNGAVL